MTFKEVIQAMGKKNKDRKAKFRELDENARLQKMLEERMKSSNQRELERYMNEDREAEIKEHLEFARKKRDEDIKFNHNPLNAKNIMKAEWEVMKEKNQFSGKGNMFKNQEFIHKNNKNLMKTNHKLLQSGNVLKGRAHLI